VSIKIDQALTNAIVGGGLAIDLVHENGAYSVWGGSSYSTGLGSYTPTNGRPYAELRTFPANKVAYSLNTSDEDVGLFQVILHYPPDAGSIVAKTQAEAVRALLAIGTVLTYSGQSVEIVGNSRDGGVADGGFFKVIVRANYRAFTAR